MADGFEIRGFQGRGDVFVITLSGGSFFGSERLVATIGAGDTSPAVLTVVPSWIAPVPPETAYRQVALSFTGSEMATLTQGPYSVLISLADSTAPLAKGFLEVYPVPGGLTPPYYRSLASPAFAESMLPNLNRDQIEMLPWTLAAATRAIETDVGRPLVLDSYDHFVRPANSVKLRLKGRPVVEVSRVASDSIAGLVLSNGAVGASSATVRVITTAPDSLQIKSLVFAVTVADVETSQALVMANYPTFGDLATAINALGDGWGATTNVGSLAVADAYGSPGTLGVLGKNPWIYTHAQRLGWWWTDPDQGMIELDEPFSGGGLVRSHRERTDSRHWGVRVTYRAGYAVDAADVALGYYPVPEDLRTACVMVASAITETIPTLGPVVSQSVKDRSYTLRDKQLLIPDAVHQLIRRYQDFVI